MKTYSQFWDGLLSEKRRGADKYTKETLQDKVLNYSDRSDVYVHFTNIKKVGVKPVGYRHQTPVGIYGYPIKFYVKPKMDNIHNWGTSWLNIVFPDYGSEFKYVYFLQEKPGINLLVIGKEIDFNKHIEMFEKWLTKEGVSDAKRAIAKWNDGRDKKYGTAAQFYSLVSIVIQYELVKNEQSIDAKMTSFFKSIGYDGVKDPGFGVLYHNDEEAQTVFFGTNSFDVIDYSINDTLPHYERKTIER